MTFFIVRPGGARPRRLATRRPIAPLAAGAAGGT
jgi:hypothetical protein